MASPSWQDSSDNRVFRLSNQIVCVAQLQKFRTDVRTSSTPLLLPMLLHLPLPAQTSSDMLLIFPFETQPLLMDLACPLRTGQAMCIQQNYVIAMPPGKTAKIRISTSQRGFSALSMSAVAMFPYIYIVSAAVFEMMLKPNLDAGKSEYFSETTADAFPGESG